MQCENGFLLSVDYSALKGQQQNFISAEYDSQMSSENVK